VRGQRREIKEGRGAAGLWKPPAIGEVVRSGNKKKEGMVACEGETKENKVDS